MMASYAFLSAADKLAIPPAICPPSSEALSTNAILTKLLKDKLVRTIDHTVSCLCELKTDPKVHPRRLRGLGLKSYPIKLHPLLNHSDEVEVHRDTNQ